MITQELLKDILHYDLETGIFSWKVSFNNGTKSGDNVNHNKGHSYLRISIKGKKYYAHRIAWIYVYGVEPNGEVDHINHNRLDNRISNLRVVDRVENNRNMKKSCKNTSGHVGVYYSKPRKLWIAFAYIDGVATNLGGYKDIKDAVLARSKIIDWLGYHENHGKEVVA